MSNRDNFEKKIKNKLDESLHDLSPDICRRLQQARYAATESASQSSYRRFFPQAKYAMVVLGIVAISLMFNLSQDDSTLTTLALESDIEMLTDNESLDFLEDLEFMQWLAETEKYVS